VVGFLFCFADKASGYERSPLLTEDEAHALVLVRVCHRELVCEGDWC
jgi:hypothetical protein